MKRIVGIDKDPNAVIRTNVETSEKFNCQAYKDMEKKRKEQYKLLRAEIDKRN